jgi:hypothetical protein
MFPVEPMPSRVFVFAVADEYAMSPSVVPGCNAFSRVSTPCNATSKSAGKSVTKSLAVGRTKP